MNDQTEEYQEQDDFYPVLEALFAYNNDLDSLENFIYVAENVLGINWREEIHNHLAVYDANTIQTAKEKLEDLTNFESAKIAWEEALKIIETPPEPQELALISSKLDDFKYWLAFFGEQGTALFNSLSEICSSHQPNYTKTESLAKINVFEHQPPPEQDYSHLEKDVDDDVLWYLNNYILLMDYYDRTIARISGRCVKLGGITLEQYPHFNYILDLLEEICETGDKIQEHPELGPLIEARIKGGAVKFKRDLADFKSELEKNATPDMIKEEENMTDIIGKLGGLAKEENKAGMGIDELINKLSSETGIAVADKYDDDDLPPPPPPDERKKLKRPLLGKRPVKHPMAKQPFNKAPLNKHAMAKYPAGKQPLAKQPGKPAEKPNPIKPNTE